MSVFRDIYEAHAKWSRKTFGEDHEHGPIGPLKHLITEAKEAMENPSDPQEFADCMFLTMDASRRAGHDVNTLLCAMIEKLDILRKRNYRKVEDGQPSFHVQDAVEVCAICDIAGCYHIRERKSRADTPAQPVQSDYGENTGTSVRGKSIAKTSNTNPLNDPVVTMKFKGCTFTFSDKREALTFSKRLREELGEVIEEHCEYDVSSAASAFEISRAALEEFSTPTEKETDQ